MKPAELTSLRRVYAQIVRGYSEAIWQDKPIYIRHLGVHDQTEIEAFKADTLDSLIERGLKTEAQILAGLKEKGLWTNEDTKTLDIDQNYLDSLRKTRSKAPLQWQIDQLDKQIAEAETKVQTARARRAKLVGKTAEAIADDRTQYEYIRLSFYRDRALKDPLFTREDMDSLSDTDSYIALLTYVNMVNGFTQDALRSISVQPFFTNYFYLCGDDVSTFFRRPIHELTLYQVNLLSYGQYFKSIFSHNDIPKEIALNPDKIEEFVTRSKNTKDLMAKTGNTQGGRVGIVGGRKEDFEAMGVKDSTADMRVVANRQYKDGRAAAQDLGFTYTN